MDHKTEQDAGLLEQGASMLEEHAEEQRTRGNDSAAEGAACSAHAIRRLAPALLRVGRGCLAQIEEPAAVAGPVLDVRAIAAAVCQRVAELPDRNSPEDWPEAMLVTGQELIDVVTCELEQAQAAPALEAPAAPAVPAGFALVPIEPTQQMLDAGRWSGAGSVSIQEEWARKEVWNRMLATITPPPAAYADDLVALVTELVQALRQAAPDNDLAGHALDYLRRNGLQGSPLRAAEAAPQAPAAPVKYVPVDSRLRDSNWRHPNDDELRTEACRAALRERGDDEGQGLDGYWKWGFAAGFNAAQAAPAAPAVDAFTHAELLEIKRAVEEFADCNETDVDYALLLRAAKAGYLECTQFHVLNQSALDLDTVAAAQAKEGGAAA